MSGRAGPIRAFSATKSRPRELPRFGVRVEPAARVPAHRIEAERLNEGLARHGLSRGPLFAVRPDDLGGPAVGLLDLESLRVSLFDILTRKVSGLEEVRAVVEDRTLLVGRLVNDLVDAIVGLSRLRGLDDRLKAGVEFLLRPEVEAVLLCQSDGERGPRERALRDENLTEAAARPLPLLGERPLELPVANEPGRYEQLSEGTPCAVLGPGLRELP